MECVHEYAVFLNGERMTEWLEDLSHAMGIAGCHPPQHRDVLCVMSRLKGVEDDAIPVPIEEEVPPEVDMISRAWDLPLDEVDGRLRDIFTESYVKLRLK
jgi:hypothetical protein